jgi:hypothetical protein
MAFTSDYNRHPDEIHHFEAAKYYKTHFLPPEIGDESVRESYSVFGVSYLNYHWAEYFYAGKFALIVSPVIQNELLAVRLSNVFLFAFLIAWFIFRLKDHSELIILPSFLLITPQVWYIFSYANNDAFAFFLSFVVIYQIAFEKSIFNQFMRSERFLNHIIGGIFFGLLSGLLLICKPNYWSFLLFAGLWLLFNFPINIPTIKKYALFLAVALSVLIFRVSLDFYANNETNFVAFSYLNKVVGNLEAKDSKLLIYQEKIARYDMKPSTLENDLQSSFKDLKLRDKGLSLTELFTSLGWHDFSFSSLVGVYGYMDIWATKWFYKVFAVPCIGFILYIFFVLIRGKEKKSIQQLAITVFSSILTIAISIYLSWTYAFQPQGRYLFPIIPMFALLIFSNRRYVRESVLNWFVLITFLLSTYSFIFVALWKINR